MDNLHRQATERALGEVADERRRVEDLHQQMTETARAQAKAEGERDTLREQVAELRRGQADRTGKGGA